MTEPHWKTHTPEYDGHAPDDWAEGCETQYNGSEGWYEPIHVHWAKACEYRYRAKQPDLLAQCLALPQADREALIEALQKPQRDWADDVWDAAYERWLEIDEHIADVGDDSREAAAVIRSMCRPKEDGNSMAEVIRKAMA